MNFINFLRKMCKITQYSFEKCVNYTCIPLNNVLNLNSKESKNEKKTIRKSKRVEK